MSSKNPLSVRIINSGIYNDLNSFYELEILRPNLTASKQQLNHLGTNFEAQISGDIQKV